MQKVKLLEDNSRRKSRYLSFDSEFQNATSKA
jgi:hypothetical protein